MRAALPQARREGARVVSPWSAEEALVQEIVERVFRFGLETSALGKEVLETQREGEAAEYTVEEGVIRGVGVRASVVVLDAPIIHEFPAELREGRKAVGKQVVSANLRFQPEIHRKTFVGIFHIVVQFH